MISKVCKFLSDNDMKPSLIKVKNAFHTHKLIKNSRLRIIDNMGHLIEEPIFNQFKIDLKNHLEINC